MIRNEIRIVTRGWNHRPRRRRPLTRFEIGRAAYPAFRRRFEVCVSSEQGDLVMGHNLRLVHGGLMGGPSRLLEPLCLVVDRPEGDDYEAWLARQWRSAGGDGGTGDDG